MGRTGLPDQGIAVEWRNAATRGRRMAGESAGVKVEKESMVADRKGETC
jgi:hypothetical protein